jgi:hypothetical protein
MKIKKNGEIIEAQYINETLVSLKPFENNSAPCSHCAFLDKFKLECTFPKDKVKECKFEQGTERGWNTLEYTLLILRKSDEIIKDNKDNNS